MDSTARLDEEEARRRRTTDCIYFLASPLTCKKGSECEYRHSDAARMNPRDCWYWFHGNCSNPKCSFRHPPLDNLLGTPTTPRATQQSAPQAPAPAPAPAATPAQAHGSFPAKQGVPCYYFQKGMCAKGDRCAFLHVPQSAGSGNPSPQPGVVATAKVFTPALQPNLQSKNSWTKPNSSSQQNTPAVGIINKSKVNAHDGNKPSAVQKQNLTATKADHSSRAYQNHSNSYAQSGGPKHYYQPHHQPSVEDDLTENSTEVGEFVREPSAGSGVIVGGVDHDAEQRMKGNHSTYQHHTNGNGTRQTHGGAYESESSYRSSAAERGVSHREHMPAVTAGSSDLRHRLLKQRKLNNNSRSTEPSARHDTHLEDERSDQHHRWRGEQRDGLSRSRLRDRIRLPGERETSFDRLGSRSEDWGSRGPPRARQSPPKHSDLRGKLHERLKARSAEETPAGSSAKNSSSGEDTGSLNFAGPKSLAELKAKKGGIGSSSGEDAIVKGVGSSRVTSEIVSSREGAATSPFEGPKPLSAILKRKREAASGSATASEEAEAEDAAGVEEEPQILTSDTAGENMEVNGDEEEEEEEAFHPEDDVAYDDNVDEATAAQELEEEHQDVEVAAEDYDYEAEGGVAEEDNDYQEYQDDDDLEDDDDDFARKVGVMMS